MLPQGAVRQVLGTRVVPIATLAFRVLCLREPFAPCPLVVFAALHARLLELQRYCADDHEPIVRTALDIRSLPALCVGLSFQLRAAIADLVL